MNVITNNNIKCTIALAALQNVVDPEIGLNVVDLGLIYQIDFDEADSRIFCTMTLTTQFCPMGEFITDAVAKTLDSTFPENEINVKLTFTPPWSNQMISEEGQNFLNR
ncbi:MAG TPA: metal-sulfur cluster assembly factor [Chitinophagaceae bacterium]